MARKRSQDSGMRKGVSYRITFGDVVPFLTKIKHEQVTLRGRIPEIAHFSFQSGLIKDHDGVMALAEKGKRFLDDPLSRSGIFRSIVLQIEQFSRIWSEIERTATLRENRISRSDIERSVLKSMKTEIGHSDSSTVNIYTGRVIDWASAAGLLEQLGTGRRRTTYQVHLRTDHPTSTELDTLAATGTAVVESKVVGGAILPAKFYLDEIERLICALTRHPKERELLEEVRFLADQWRKEPNDSDAGDKERRIVLHLLDHALSSGQREEFEMVAETIWIMRREH